MRISDWSSDVCSSDLLYLFVEHGVARGFDGASVLILPKCGEISAPVVFTIPLQLLAYHVAVLRGTDVDQPRNLAKSVTVEDRKSVVSGKSVSVRVDLGGSRIIKKKKKKKNQTE